MSRFVVRATLPAAVAAILAACAQGAPDHTPADLGGFATDHAAA